LFSFKTHFQIKLISTKVMKHIYALVAFLTATANLHAQTSCTGTPNAGNAVANACVACGSSTLVLEDTGGTTGSGITYQWQYSNDNAAWTDLSGGVTGNYSLTTTGAYYYRCEVICSASDSTAYTAGVYVYYESSCPCIPSYADANPGSFCAMNGFSVAGYAGTAIVDTYGLVKPGYLDRSCSLSPVNFHQGAAYLWSLSIIGNYEHWEAQIWIDFNNDGVFQTSEAVQNVVGPAGVASLCAYAAHLTSGTLAIPTTAPSGIHRMRVREVCVTNLCPISAAMDPCNDSDATYRYYYGNTFDYEANIKSTTSTPAISNNAEIEIYPNPANDILTIKMDNASFNSFIIINSIGERILQQKINGTQTNLNVNMFPVGVYYIFLKSDSGMEVKKFIKM